MCGCGEQAAHLSSRVVVRRSHDAGRGRRNIRKLKNILDVDYASTGSGDGVEQMITRARTCSVARMRPMTDEQDRGRGRARRRHSRAAYDLGAVVPIYNLKDVKELKFTGPVLA